MVMETDFLLVHAVDALVFSRLPSCTDDWSTLTACVHPRHFIRMAFDKITAMVDGELLMKPVHLASCLKWLNLSEASGVDSICFSLHDFEHILCKQYCSTQQAPFRPPPFGDISDICFDDLLMKLSQETRLSTSAEAMRVLNSIDTLATAAQPKKDTSNTGSLDRESLLGNLARENLLRTIIQMRSEMDLLKTVVQDLSLKLQTQDAEKLALMVKMDVVEKEAQTRYDDLQKRNDNLKRKLHDLIVHSKPTVSPKKRIHKSRSPVEPTTTTMSISMASEVLLPDGQVWRKTEDKTNGDSMIRSQTSSGTSGDEGSQCFDSTAELESPPPSDPCSSSTLLNKVTKSVSSPAANSTHNNHNFRVEPVLMPLKPSSSAQELKNKLSTLSRKLRQAESCLNRVIGPIKR